MLAVRLCSGLLGFWVLQGCAPQTARPVEDIQLPAYNAAEQTRVLERQCGPLITEPLDNLLEQVDQDNLQLLAAWQRVEQAQAQARQARSAFWPSLQMNAEAARSKSPPLITPTNGAGPGQSPQSPGGSGATGEPTIHNSYRVSAAASYELDLWGRLDSAANAAQYAVSAAEGDARAMSVTISAQLLETWYDLAFARARDALLRDQVNTSEKLLELLKLRYLNGQTSVLDALQQEQQLQALQAALQQNRQQERVSEHQLAVLLGTKPELDGYAVESRQPSLPSLAHTATEASFSADLLAHRPDLQSAYYQLNAANEELAQAVAQRLPGIRLSATVFDQSQSLDNFGGNLFWQIAASITQPLFTGGRIEAQIDAAEAATNQSIYQYQQTLLNSLQELASAWSSQRYTASRIDALKRQQTLAEESFGLVTEQYQRGAVDFLRVLNALQSMIDVQQTLLQARRQYVSYRVQFCRALGDDWLPGATPSPATEEHGQQQNRQAQI